MCVCIRDGNLNLIENVNFMWLTFAITNLCTVMQKLTIIQICQKSLYMWCILKSELCMMIIIDKHISDNLYVVTLDLMKLKNILY